ncbi:uncharacterized protein N7459_000038 [Penicillium hispanicum]|uniref:uncharacterized protein n=1 Tax=Penicillium hispanicum TaxID=1080232 RepID=UPI0025419324|nr:uncharacterized protein N7459_000038 [Penicillium hispanicum]KAJ5593830.1 hypothetical protein N7459_000038 [Penicillium hispanicum]
MSSSFATPGFPTVLQPPNSDPATQGVAGVLPSEASPMGLLGLLNVPVAEVGEWVANAPVMQYSLQDMVHVLEQYPKLLLRDDFSSPFLHRSLYDEDVPDMTTLARTSMAVCCGSAMETPDGARFARHAMEVERQRLIESYPTYQCMQQWDALHAMVVYGILELRTSSGLGRDEWKQKSYSKGLKAPFLAKMTRAFTRSHLESPGADLMSASSLPLQSMESWTVAETARRTIFLANIIHFLSHHDPVTGKPSPYYEPLDDELILNLPLPCSHALWSVRTEPEWRLTMEYCQSNSSPSTTDFPSAFHLVPGCLTLKFLLGHFSREYLQTVLVSNLGFGGSDELRSFVILCALKQFT